MRLIITTIVLSVAIVVSYVATDTLAQTTGNSIAFFAKIFPKVLHKTTSEDWTPATAGGTVSYGDVIRSEEKALAVIKFTDGSIVKVRENSELHVKGDPNQQALQKDINLQEGVIGFIIETQNENDVFRFTSPTSVAAIRGTEGSFGAGINADTLIVLEGVVNLTNTSSNESRDVPAGFTGISRADGTLEVRPSTSDERMEARETVNILDTDNQLEIELEDGEGNKKKLKIDYKE